MTKHIDTVPIEVSILTVDHDIKGTVHAGKRAVDDPPAGMDDIQWTSLFAILYARGYNGDLSIEPHSKTWRGELGSAGVTFTRDFIKRFMM